MHIIIIIIIIFIIIIIIIIDAITTINASDVLNCFQIGMLSNMSLLLRLCAGWFVDAIILSTWAAIDPMTIQLETMIDSQVKIA